jgi:hypothetical protein
MSKTIANIVDELGGTSEVAAACDVVPSAVTNWKDTNRVPKWHREPVLRLAKKKGVPLTKEEIETPGELPAADAA